MIDKEMITIKELPRYRNKKILYDLIQDADQKIKSSCLNNNKRAIVKTDRIFDIRVWRKFLAKLKKSGFLIRNDADLNWRRSVEIMW